MTCVRARACVEAEACATALAVTLAWRGRGGAREGAARGEKE